MADRGIGNSNSSNSNSSNSSNFNSYGNFGNRGSNSSVSTSSAARQPAPRTNDRKRMVYDIPEQVMDTSDRPQGFDSAVAQFSNLQLVSQTPASAPAPSSPVRKMEQEIWDALRADWETENEKTRASGTKQAQARQQHQGLTQTEAFANEVAETANELECVELELFAGEEQGLVKGLLNGKAWTQACITIMDDVNPGFLLELESGLREAGLQKSIALVVNAPATLRELPSLPSASKRRAGRRSDAPAQRSAIQFEALSLKESKIPSNSLLQTLKQENPKLKELEWTGESNTNSLVLALQEGSHELHHLGLCPLPSNPQALISMLKLKRGLVSLRLEGDFAASQLSLAQVLEAAPHLTVLGLESGRISATNLAGCADAFAKSKLELLNLLGVEFGSNFDGSDPSFLQLVEGLRTATRLSTLRFFEFGGSVADQILLKAFAKNPAAETLSNGGGVYAATLPGLLSVLNKDRVKAGWNQLALELLDPGAYPDNPTRKDSPRSERSGIEPPTNSKDSD